MRASVTAGILAGTLLGCRQPDLAVVEPPGPSSAARWQPACEAGDREALRAVMFAFEIRERESDDPRDFADPEFRQALAHPCLAPLGGARLVGLDDEVLDHWWNWPRAGAEWIEEVLRDPAEPVEFVALPPTPRHLALRRAKDDPLLASITCVDASDCEPSARHLLREADRAFLLEAHEMAIWTPYWGKRYNNEGYLEGTLGIECAAKVATIDLEARGEAWLDCLDRGRDQRALPPIGDFRTVDDGVLVVYAPKCRLEIDIATGATTWHGCPKAAVPDSLPVDLVGRIAFHAILRPHLVVGAPVGEGLIVPPELGPVELSARAIESLPSRQRRVQQSHYLSTEYRFRRGDAEVEGTCYEDGLIILGESAVCELIWDLWAIVPAITPPPGS